MTIAIAIIAGVGLVAALALAIADKYLAVREDPRIGMVTAALPGANCGGCGFPGCDGYARALVAGTAPNGACAAGGDACAAAIAKALGRSEVHAGGPRWLRLPEGPLAAPGRYRSPPGAQPRGVR